MYYVTKKSISHISVTTRKYETSLSKLGSFYRLTYRKDAAGTQLFHVIRRSIIKTSASSLLYLYSCSRVLRDRSWYSQR